MTRFEEIGVDHQYKSTSIQEAITAFEHSCKCCCLKGIHLDCPQM